MSISWSAVLGSGFATALVWGVVMIVKASFQRPLTQASAAVQLNESALKMIKAAQEDAEQAGKEASEARREASEARREASDARRSADDAAREVRMIKSAILSPMATLDGLRQMIGDPGSNGLPHVHSDNR